MRRRARPDNSLVYPAKSSSANRWSPVVVTARVQPVGSKPRWRGRGGGNAVLLPDQSDPQANHTFSKRGFMGGLTPQQEVLERSGRRCCLCFGLYGNLSCKRGQIAHLDHNHQNNIVDNLAFLCLEHHDEYDTCTSQSKGWTIKEAKLYRDMRERITVGTRNRGIRGHGVRYPPFFDDQTGIQSNAIP